MHSTRAHTQPSHASVVRSHTGAGLKEKLTPEIMHSIHPSRGGGGRVSLVLDYREDAKERDRATTASRRSSSSNRRLSWLVTVVAVVLRRRQHTHLRPILYARLNNPFPYLCTGGHSLPGHRKRAACHAQQRVHSPRAYISRAPSFSRVRFR